MTEFTDSFTGSNGTTALVSGWTSGGVGVNAAIINGNALGVAGAGTPTNQSIHYQDHGNVDHFGECVVGANAGALDVSNAGALIAVRVVDRNIHVALAYDTDRYRIRFNGVFGNIDSYVTALVPGDLCQLVAEGTGTGAYKFYLNGVVRIQVDLSHVTYDSSTLVGTRPKMAADSDTNGILDSWRSGLIADLAGAGGSSIVPILNTRRFFGG